MPAVALAVGLLSTSSCRRHHGPDAVPSDLRGSEISLVRSGGIAAMSLLSGVRGDGPSWLAVARRPCATGSSCAPLDSVGGALAPADARRLFERALVEGAFALRDDYGNTRGAADMMDYTLTVRIGGATKTVHADDGTMPAAMRHVIDALQGTIEAARPARRP